ncbi:hypothetical protein B0H14DRAFT_2643360 [Mycena olivaceomarginata]|nr:hypothetical protein B0H14DRAFT_2643360 [Mycena olivaceomarginata]
MPLEITKLKTVSGIDALKFKKRNYVVSLESMSDVFLYAGILEYILGEVLRPTSLLDELLGIHIECGADMVNVAGKVHNISKQVFEISTLDADKLALAVLLHLLSPELCSIHEKYEDDNLVTPADIVKSLEKEKLRWEEETNQVSAEEHTNAAHAQKPQLGKAGSSGRGLCVTCNGPHCTDECWGKGSAMKGHCEEVLEWRVA